MMLFKINLASPLKKSHLFILDELPGHGIQRLWRPRMFYNAVSSFNPIYSPLILEVRTNVII